MNIFRSMKYLAITAGLLALCSTPAVVQAQQAEQPPQADSGQQAMHQKHDELANLNLTDDQKAQVQKIHESMKSQMDAVKNDSTLSSDQKHAKMQEIHKASHQQVMQILTPEQRQQAKSDEMARKAAKQQQAPPPQQ